MASLIQRCTSGGLYVQRCTEGTSLLKRCPVGVDCLNCTGGKAAEKYTLTVSGLFLIPCEDPGSPPDPGECGGWQWTEAPNGAFELTRTSDCVYDSACVDTTFTDCSWVYPDRPGAYRWRLTVGSSGYDLELQADDNSPCSSAGLMFTTLDLSKSGSFNCLAEQSWEVQSPYWPQHSCRFNQCVPCYYTAAIVVTPG